MTAPRHTAPVVSFRSCMALCYALLLVSTSLNAPVAQAAEDTALDAVQLAALAGQQRIDRETGAFDSPLLIRLRARVSPSWPGPRGAPLVTERRHCPEISVMISDDAKNGQRVMVTVPRFC